MSKRLFIDGGDKRQMLKPSRAMEENYLPARICEAGETAIYNLARKEGLPARRNRSAARSQSMHGLETRSLFYRFVQWRTLNKKNWETNLGCHHMTTLCRWTL